jgi:hypothetical protein
MKSKILNTRTEQANNSDLQNATLWLCLCGGFAENRAGEPLYRTLTRSRKNADTINTEGALKNLAAYLWYLP